MHISSWNAPLPHAKSLEGGCHRTLTRPPSCHRFPCRPQPVLRHLHSLLNSWSISVHNKYILGVNDQALKVSSLRTYVILKPKGEFVKQHLKPEGAKIDFTICLDKTADEVKRDEFRIRGFILRWFFTSSSPRCCINIINVHVVIQGSSFYGNLV